MGRTKQPMDPGEWKALRGGPGLHLVDADAHRVVGRTAPRMNPGAEWPRPKGGPGDRGLHLVDAEEHPVVLAAHHGCPAVMAHPREVQVKGGAAVRAVLL